MIVFWIVLAVAIGMMIVERIAGVAQAGPASGAGGGERFC